MGPIDYIFVAASVPGYDAYHHGDGYRFSAQPLTILGVTGPFSILAENIYSLCEESFHVSG